MEWGMMWFYGETAENKKKIKKEKNTTKSYREKLLEAIEFFREKYDYRGDIEVQVLTLEEFEPIPNIKVSRSGHILKNTFWIGTKKGDFRKDKEVKNGEN